MKITHQVSYNEMRNILTTSAASHNTSTELVIFAFIENALLVENEGVLCKLFHLSFRLFNEIVLAM